MLAIRLQRTGRKGHAQYRVIVQDSHKSPKSGKIVAQVGHYNPHNKAVVLDKEKVSFYLEHGAQPSDRIVKMLTAEGITLPKWVKSATVKERVIRNPEKLRRNRPAEDTAAEEPVDEASETVSEETPVDTVADVAVEEAASQDEAATNKDLTQESESKEASEKTEPKA